MGLPLQAHCKMIGNPREAELGFFSVALGRRGSVDPQKSRSSTYWRRVTPGCCQSSKSLVRLAQKGGGSL
jgi:hypothetical protein